MGWVNHDLTVVQLICIRLLRFSQARLPQHVAIIMDGNRRFARRDHLATSVGHERGFEKLAEAMKWCLELGVRELSVYAFSIENFKRSEAEVSALLQLAADKFHSLLDEIDEINACGVRVRVVGRWALLPPGLRARAARAMLATRRNRALLLNIAFAYTGRDEVSRAASHIVDGVRSAALAGDEVDAALVSRTLELGAPDLLIRTSGEVRLSDFMIWQVSNTVLYFTNTLWPEFSIWDMLAAMLHFHAHAPPLLPDTQVSHRKQHFLKNLEESRWRTVEEMARLISS